MTNQFKTQHYLLTKVLPIFLLAIFAISILFAVFGQSKITVINNCKVLDLQQQQIIQGQGNSINTEIRYLIITNKGTFISETSALNGKFNNSDIFFNLKKDSTYTFKVCGLGKSAVSDYQNILEILTNK